MEWIHIDPPIRPFTEVEKRIIELLDQGKTLFQIAYKLHISCEECRDMIFEIRKKECLMAGKQKLSADEQAEIVEKYKSGETARDLAAQYDVSHGTVENIVKRAGATRKHGSKPKKTMINPEFDAAVDSMIAEGKSADAEPQAAIAEPTPTPKDKLPEAVYRALLDKLNDCAFEIEERELRIAELKAEIADLKRTRDAIVEWKEPYEK